MANIIDDEREACTRYYTKNSLANSQHDWLERFDDDWLARYGPATIELFQGFIDNNCFAEFAATPEGARIYAYGERWRAQERPSRPRRAAARKASVRSLIKQAERAGKTVSSIERDGVTVDFGEQAPDTNQQDEVETWIKKHAH